MFLWPLKQKISQLKDYRNFQTDIDSSVIPKIFYYSADIEHLTKIGKNIHHYLNLVNKFITESETKFQQLYDLSLPEFRRTDKKQICTSPGKSTVIFSFAGATTS